MSNQMKLFAILNRFMFSSWKKNLASPLIHNMRQNFLRKVNVPDDIDSVATIDKQSESPPDKAGMTTTGIERIWKRVKELYMTGAHPGISLCLIKRGHIVMLRALGHRSGNGPDDPPGTYKELMKPDTPVCQFSASKAVTAMLIHRLTQDGFLDINDRVVEYIPEFGRNGKEEITIDHLLCHKAGISYPPPDVDAEILFDPGAFLDVICSMKPTYPPGRYTAYHAVTGGTVLGEIARIATGRDLRSLIDDYIKKPLGFKWFNFGVTPGKENEVAINSSTGMPLLFPVSRLASRALGTTWGNVVSISNDPRFFKVIIPAANLVATAAEMALFFNLILQAGKLNDTKIFSESTIKKAIEPSGPMVFDRTLMIFMRYSHGLMLGADPVGIWGPRSRDAFGHIGFIQILCWADPSREISVSLQTTGKSLFGTHLISLFRFVQTVCEETCTMDKD